MWREDELEVSGILLELPSLISAAETKLHDEGSDGSRRLALSWGAKRKRSDAVEPSSSRIPVDSLKPSSPSTPFSFCPSESDEKPFKSPKQMTKTPEVWPRKCQDFVKKNKLQGLNEQKLLHQCENIMLKSTLASRAISQELRPEIKHKEQVPQLDLEMRLGLPTINQDKQEQQNNVQQQNQQQITMEVEGMKEEMMTMMGNNVDEAYPDTLPLFPGSAIPEAGEFSFSMDSISFLDRLKAKTARQWRLKILRENRSSSSNRLKLKFSQS